MEWIDIPDYATEYNTSNHLVNIIIDTADDDGRARSNVNTVFMTLFDHLHYT